MEKTPVELAIWRTRQKLWEVIQENQLGAAINRMIFQEIADRLALEEQQIIKNMEAEQKENERLKGE